MFAYVTFENKQKKSLPIARIDPDLIEEYGLVVNVQYLHDLEDPNEICDPMPNMKIWLGFVGSF